MKYFIWSWVSVFALLVLPFAGCSGSTNEGPLGRAVMRRWRAAGTGGQRRALVDWPVPVAPRRLPPGSGQALATTAPAAPWSICFNLSEDGSAAHDGYGFGAAMLPLGPRDRAQVCSGSSSYNQDIPVADGAFEVGAEGEELHITGTFDGNTASGDATLLVAGETCSGSWTATPSP